jgi:hypothetical protein
MCLNQIGQEMAKTYNELKMELEINSTLQNLLDDLDLTEQDCEELLEGKKTKIIFKIIALGQAKRLGTQVKRVRSTKELSAKMDELAKAVAISGAIAAMAVVAGLDGGKSVLSKIVGFTAGSG